MRSRSTATIDAGPCDYPRDRCAGRATLIINATFDNSIAGDPNAATIEGVINSAIGFYQSTFANPIVVSIQFGEMTSGLGQSNTGFDNVSYSTYLAALKADTTSADDATA